MTAAANELVDMMNGALGSTIPVAHKMGVKVVEARRGFAAATRGLYQLRAVGK
jgi:hypothetical protein